MPGSLAVGSSGGMGANLRRRASRPRSPGHTRLGRKSLPRPARSTAARLRAVPRSKFMQAARSRFQATLSAHSQTRLVRAAVEKQATGSLPQVDGSDVPGAAAHGNMLLCSLHGKLRHPDRMARTAKGEWVCTGDNKCSVGWSDAPGCIPVAAPNARLRPNSRGHGEGPGAAAGGPHPGAPLRRQPTSGRLAQRSRSPRRKGKSKGGADGPGSAAGSPVVKPQGKGGLDWHGATRFA